MYECQSCLIYTYSHRLPITFTNYMRTKSSSSFQVDKSIDIVVCPIFSSKDAPNSLLSNKEIVEDIVAFPFPDVIKLHPLTYQFDEKNPLFSLSVLEQENTRKLLRSKNILPETQTNILNLIEHTRVLICDFDSFIPFEAFYLTIKNTSLFMKKWNNKTDMKIDDLTFMFFTVLNNW